MSAKRPLAALILAAGRGERMNSEIPKVLHQAAGFSLLEHVVDAVRQTGIRRIAVVVGPSQEKVRSFVNGVDTVVQTKRLGTAHAVMQARKQFGRWKGGLLVLPADAPCVKPETLCRFIKTHGKSLASASILTAEVNDPKGYGRVLRRGDQVIGIREELDASPSERRIREINSGIYLFDALKLFRQLDRIKQNRKKKEYYLTDVIEAFRSSGESVEGHRVHDSKELLGVNTRRELSVAHQILNERELARHSKQGVSILDPQQTFIAKGVTIGRDTVIHPFTWIERGVSIGRKCEVGPFAKIRGGSQIGDEVVVGSFVEVVRSKVGSKTFVKHLSYLGDAQVGKKVNVGAGTITANFDGRRKNKTVVQDNVFLGCNTVLVAPVTVGKGAKTGAGAVVRARHSIPAGKTAVGIPAVILQKKRGRK
ncbi:MAG: bifunctional N-acetylglucosamine-1-phosphate uridyltransferase/glucosamine-1-phosphate acetyltransferase [Candidatus Omnitrophica bacterium]|nr:bifunctional N-acetylglucosamine-1-phosphate uridyltransferase/glucosamine-1-phosphate acetyltransferase [Candidatus Omnitrophota bacterium]